jgi:glutaryl-CoA dehydrogenase
VLTTSAMGSRWAECHVARHHASIGAGYPYEGTDTVQSLVVGRGITGIRGFA